MRGPVKRHNEDENKEPIIVIKNLILSHNNALPLDRLREEYKKQTGEEIPFLRCGYNSLFHMLTDDPDIQGARSETGYPILQLVPNKKTAHLHELIEKQKPCTKVCTEPVIGSSQLIGDNKLFLLLIIFIAIYVLLREFYF